MIGPPDSGGPYKTMCVRACDGYYFPLRHNAWRKNFGPDAISCRNACGDQGRLYYYPLNGGSPDTMVDLAGRPYKDMKTAFGYRKKLVAGCACKPAPWSFEEASRHRQYHEQEAASLNQSHMETTSSGEPTDSSAPAVPDGTVGAVGQQEDVPRDNGRSEIPLGAAGIASDTPNLSPQRQRPDRAAEIGRAPQKRRRPRAPALDVKRTAYQPAFGFSLFNPPKSKYLWPGDAR